jgi:DNA polymerase
VEAKRLETETNSAETELAEVAAEVKVCPKCELCRTRTHAVPGRGPSDA